MASIIEKISHAAGNPFWGDPAVKRFPAQPWAAITLGQKHYGQKNSSTPSCFGRRGKPGVATSTIDDSSGSVSFLIGACDDDGGDDTMGEGGGTAAVTKEELDRNAPQGTIKNGQIILDDPSELAEGTRVEVLPVEGARPSLGMREEDWPTTADGIAALLSRMDQVEPGWLSPQDDAAWRAALRTQREMEKARFFEDAEELRRMWE